MKNLTGEVKKMETNKFPTVRLIVSVVLVLAYAIGSSIWSRMYSSYTGIVAAHQLNDDSVSGNALAFFFRYNDLVGLAMLVVFVLVMGYIWRNYIKLLLNATLMTFLLLTVLGLGLLGCAPRASTESEGTSFDDVYDVQPFETAFQIPAIAGSFSDQEKLNSEKYYDDKKVASKRIIIQKENVGGAYRPKTYVYLVDRTPVARQWTEDNGTGTNQTNEALCAETRGSRRVCYQISMGAMVTEGDAAKYLYYYPAIQLKDPKKAGVFKSSSLADIVDNQVRSYAVSILGRETKKRMDDLDQVVQETNEIIATAFTETKNQFAKQGITIAYLGMGGDIKLDPEIQAVIDQLYVAQKQREIAGVRATTTAIDAAAQKNALILKGQGDAQALEVLTKAFGGDTTHIGEALRWYRWDGSLLTVMLAPTTQPAVSLPIPTTEPAPIAPPAPSATPKK